MVDGGALLFADRVAGGDELAQARLDDVGRYRVTGLGHRAKGGFLDGVLLGRVIESGEESGVRESRPGVAGARRAVLIEGDDRVVAQDPGEDRFEALRRDETGGFAGDVLEKLWESEDGLVEGESSGQLAAALDELANFLLRWLGLGSRDQLLDELFGVDVCRGFLMPIDVALV